MFDMMFKLRVSVLNLILGDGGDAAGVTGHMPAKPVTAVQDWFSTCVSVKPLNIFQDTLGKFLALFVVTKAFILSLNMMFS